MSRQSIINENGKDKKVSGSNALIYYHGWLKDAHAMEQQAEIMLKAMSRQLMHYPELKSRIALHIEETRQQQSLLETILERHGISHSTVEDAMGKVPPVTQAIVGSLKDIEVVKSCISGYLLENLEIASYTALISAATELGDRESIPVFRRIYDQELAMSDWLILHLTDVTQQFLLQSDEFDTEVKI